MRAFSLLLSVLTLTTLMQAAESSAALTSEIMKVEEAFRQAKLKNDVAALGEIIANDYIGVNQYGSRRDKAEVIELWRTFKLSSLTPAQVEVRFAGDVAIVIGSQTEVNPGAKESLVFTRIYVKRQGRWQMIANTQMIPAS